ncbi:MAG: TonB C-terminal domain-containing protein [Acidobacteriota bacterium]|nr:MAG: TonB C-terminal domain-containing protein [Acidobacteriota bacterium]
MLGNPLHRALGVSFAAHAVLVAALSFTWEKPRPKLLPPIRAYRISLASLRGPSDLPAAIPRKSVSVKKKIPPKAAPEKKAEKKQEKPKPAVREPKKAPSPKLGIQGAGAGPGGGVSRLDAKDFTYLWYLDTIQRKIAQTWYKPGTAGVSADAVVYFRIGRGGRITGVELAQSSGSTAYDHAALRAVLGASPMPPLPKRFPGESLGVHFTFLREAK